MPHRPLQGHPEILWPPLPASFRAELLSRLRALPFDAFARLSALLLLRLGYQEVRPAGRAHYFRGRNQHTRGSDGASSGYDLTALLPAPAAARRRPAAIISLKRFGQETPVHQRQADELRGACLRAGASEAVLITTGPLSATLSERASVLQAAPFAPLRLIDGEEFASLLAANGLGIRRAGGKASSLKLDEAFFARLTARDRQVPDSSGNHLSAEANPGSDPVHDGRTKERKARRSTAGSVDMLLRVTFGPVFSEAGVGQDIHQAEDSLAHAAPAQRR